VFVRQAWADAGSPFVHTYANGMQGTHPLFKVLRQAEADSAKRLAEVRVKRRGPAPKAVVQASIGESPAAKLRVVRD